MATLSASTSLSGPGVTSPTGLRMQQHMGRRMNQRLDHGRVSPCRPAPAHFLVNQWSGLGAPGDDRRRPPCRHRTPWSSISSLDRFTQSREAPHLRASVARRIAEVLP